MNSKSICLYNRLSMRMNALACLKRHRFALFSPAIRDKIAFENLQIIMSLGGPINNATGRCFSTGFSTVHGERPSAEYAKLRKQSLESEFGHALNYSSKCLSTFYRFGPFLALYRAAIILYYAVKLTIWQLFVHNTKKRSIKFRETLIHLGPFYIKLGQALSTRPDIVPPVYCQELVKLQDQIPPFPNHVAIQSIESQLGVPVSVYLLISALSPLLHRLSDRFIKVD